MGRVVFPANTPEAFTVAVLSRMFLQQKRAVAGVTAGEQPESFLSTLPAVLCVFGSISVQSTVQVATQKEEHRLQVITDL